MIRDLLSVMDYELYQGWYVLKHLSSEKIEVELEPTRRRQTAKKQAVPLSSSEKVLLLRSSMGLATYRLRVFVAIRPMVSQTLCCSLSSRHSPSCTISALTYLLV